MKDKKSIYIRCPRCGREYVPSEIYIPNYFFGKPVSIERDATTGKITNFYGTDMDLVEHYVCDKCNTPFKVTAKIQFTTSEQSKYNFKEDYKTTLNKPVLFLDEQ